MSTQNQLSVEIDAPPVTPRRLNRPMVCKVTPVGWFNRASGGTSPAAATYLQTPVKALKWQAIDLSGRPGKRIKMALAIGKVVIERMNNPGFQDLDDVQLGLSQ